MTDRCGRGFIEYDYGRAGRTRAFLGCPETGVRREVLEIVLADGGRIQFPRDFSSSAHLERIHEALPKVAPGASKDAG